MTQVRHADCIRAGSGTRLSTLLRKSAAGCRPTSTDKFEGAMAIRTIGAAANTLVGTVI